jgi:hypothetical protein
VSVNNINHTIIGNFCIEKKHSFLTKLLIVGLTPKLQYYYLKNDRKSILGLELGLELKLSFSTELFFQNSNLMFCLQLNHII